MSIRKTIGGAMDRIGLREPVNRLRFWVTRPDWWREHRERKHFLSNLARPGELVFDVGASTGVYTAWLRELGATVVAVEPQPESCKEFRERHRADMARSRVTLVETAIGSAEGTAEMYRAGESAQISSLAREWVETINRAGRFEGTAWTESITVPVTTLDRLIERHGLPAFCKIDVEGFEPEVLKGLHHPIRLISFEYTPENSGRAAACLAELARLGNYRFNVAVHGQNTFHWSDWVDAGEARRRLDEPADPVLAQGGDAYARLA